jgi:hypothetical protein
MLKMRFKAKFSASLGAICLDWTKIFSGCHRRKGPGSLQAQAEVLCKIWTDDNEPLNVRVRF